MPTVKVSETAHEALKEYKASREHTSFDSAIRELLYHSPYPITSRDTYEWTVARDEALRRDNHQCVVCKSEDDLHVHHRTPIKELGDNSVRNLITLCNNCHKRHHSAGGNLELPEPKTITEETAGRRDVCPHESCGRTFKNIAGVKRHWAQKHESEPPWAE